VLDEFGEGHVCCGGHGLRGWGFRAVEGEYMIGIAWVEVDGI
jgi:hypothetical protein